MADDTSYNTFLSRANQDVSSGGTNDPSSTSQARSKFDPSSSSSSNEAIPASLRGIEATYTSDTDSDFEPVFFSYASHKLPSVDEFRAVLGAKGQNAGGIKRLSVGDFDPRGEYNGVIGKVGEASEASGKKKEESDGVGIYRVESDGKGTRVEYYVLSVGDRSLLGVVAKAVES